MFVLHNDKYLYGNDFFFILENIIEIWVQGFGSVTSLKKLRQSKVKYYKQMQGKRIALIIANRRKDEEAKYIFTLHDLHLLGFLLGLLPSAFKHHLYKYIQVYNKS
jgi:hypothetical protein